MSGSIFKIWLTKSTVKDLEETENEEDQEITKISSNLSESESEHPEEEDFVRFDDTSTLYERVILVLQEHSISFFNQSKSQNAVDALDDKKIKSEILIQAFVPDSIVEDLLLKLQTIGVGLKEGSGFSVVPTSVSYYFTDGNTEEANRVKSVDATKNAKETYVNRFYDSIKSRLIVAEVIKR